jgi:general secretion pathway protein L
MKTWLHLSADGLAAPSAQWPCCVWRAPGDSQDLLLGEAAQLLAGQSIHLLLPMEMCSGFRSEKWPSRRRPSPQAIAFAIEDQLAEDLDALHVCAGARDRLGCYPVLVTHKERFKVLLQLLATLGIKVSSVQVDADLLPADSPGAVEWFGRRVLGGETRLAMPDPALKAVEALLGEPLRWLDESASQAVIEHALWARKSPPIDLLQGEFRQGKRAWPWSIFAIAAGVLFMLDWGFKEVRIQYLEGQAQQLYRQSVERFQALYPQQTRIVDLAAQLKAIQGQGVSHASTPLSRLISLTEQVIGGGDVDVQRLEFRAGDGWKIQLTASSFSELEQLRERGQQSGMPVRIGNASKEGRRVQAVLMLEESL